MSLEMHFNGAYRVRARAVSSFGVHSVVQQIIEIGGKVTEMPYVIFTTLDPQAERKAAALAHAINVADEQFHPLAEREREPA